jgi:mannitol-specific phosphotransferase system IIBC component
MKRNVPIFGFIIGMIMPIIGIFIVYLVMHNDTSMPVFFREMFNRSKEAALVLTLALLLNLVPFIYFTNKRLDLSARGILVATVLYRVFILLLTYVW